MTELNVHPLPKVVQLPASDSGRRYLKGDLVVRRIRLRSVTRVVLPFSLCLLTTTLVVGVVLWNLAEVAGWSPNSTHLLKGIGSSARSVDGMSVFVLAAVSGAALAAIVTIIAVGATALYNVISGRFGGFEIFFTSPRYPTRH